ncbi:hypothetical protein NDU88_006131 [Pleurodeles waltl]|uniref:Uncharacterized protein n=1 Tax=Pleurodeles waltl TaxID=8319 RepID=A0AAV7TE81_PLEWA|nr:hypothetical protein NDU88_006131 [Pleurodeles waltl]
MQVQPSMKERKLARKGPGKEKPPSLLVGIPPPTSHPGDGVGKPAAPPENTTIAGQPSSDRAFEAWDASQEAPPPAEAQEELTAKPEAKAKEDETQVTTVKVIKQKKGKKGGKKKEQPKESSDPEEEQPDKWS